MSYLLARSDSRRIPLPDGCAHMVCTSPPYFGLRDYGTADWEGGDPECDHLAGPAVSNKSTLRAGRADRPNGRIYEDEKLDVSSVPFRDTCRKCGARRIDRQIGLEPTIDGYLDAMRAVFVEVWRVMRPDATLWLNIGDSFATQSPIRKRNSIGYGSRPKKHPLIPKPSEIGRGFKSKDLCGIPWRVAFALQEMGFYLRSEIIWAKPNPMPESVTDRPTKAHEQVFLLSKRPAYYYDAEAVREKASDPERPAQPGYARELPGNPYSGQNGKPWGTEGNRNLRSVWSITPEPTPLAHFATFPRELASRCIKAGTSERGCCPACGAPWRRVVEKELVPNPGGGRRRADAPGMVVSATSVFRTGMSWKANHLGFRQSCPCPPADPVPCLVLDPFSGAASTGVAALALGRRYVGLDLNPEYLVMSRRRIDRPHARVRKVDKPLPLFSHMEDHA